VKPQRVLVVEDEPSILDSVLYALRTEGFDAVGLGTCTEALAWMRRESADFLILDVGLPDGSGMELCKTVRMESRVPIIFLTARSSEVDRIVGLEIGADDYMVKPFSPRELTARVKAVLRRVAGNAAAPEAAKSKGLVFDEAGCQASFHGMALGLSVTEWKLLKALAAHPGRVFSREQLMDLAWDDPGAAMERTVDAHIKSLRHKLRAAHAEVEPIQTHRGFGYSYQA
jgi:two-component system, OmpR family, catabolic regulation response regulator CreB